MQDDNINLDVQTFQYHHVVVTDVRVNVKTGEVVEVADPYVADDWPSNADLSVWDVEDDAWLEKSPADFEWSSVAVWQRSGWGRSRTALESILAKAAERVLPLCISCNLPIPEGETHVAGSGADPMCADCWHEACLMVGKSCEQCSFCVVFVCAECEFPSDGEKHLSVDGQTICSECLVSAN